MIFYRAVAWLPFPALYFVAWLGYLLIYHVARYRREVVKQNLSRAFPEKTDREVAKLARKFYRQFSQVAFEILKARRMTPEDFRQRVKFINPQLMHTYTENSKKSVILLTIHQCNWEWMLHGASSELGVPLDPVFKPLHNKTADKLIFDIRSQFGSRPLPMAESARDILRRRREFRIFTMIADQSPIRGERSYWTQFMNQPAAFFLGTEAIAKMTRFPILYAQCRRVRTGYYEVEFHELAKPPYDKKSHDITDRYVELIEQSIRAQPESWLWSNRRWKRDREADEMLDEQEGTSKPAE
jgi:KDO2-lipid IV(A) lauroyltransferase